MTRFNRVVAGIIGAGALVMTATGLASAHGNLQGYRGSDSCGGYDDGYGAFPGFGGLDGFGAFGGRNRGNDGCRSVAVSRVTRASDNHTFVFRQNIDHSTIGRDNINATDGGRGRR